jgi:hypothetical protein
MDLATTDLQTPDENYELTITNYESENS